MSNDSTRIDLGEDLIGILPKKQENASASPHSFSESDQDKTQVLMDPDFAPTEPPLNPEVTEGPVFFIPLDQQDAILPEADHEITSIREKSDSDDDHIESADILIREGLLDEAKKYAFRVRARNPGHPRVREILQKIEQLELSQLYQNSSRKQRPHQPIEDSSKIIRQLSNDLGIPNYAQSAPIRWSLPNAEGRSAFDLGLAFYEMGCTKEALKYFQKLIAEERRAQSTLSAIGIMALHLAARCWIETGDAFTAKTEVIAALSDQSLSSEEMKILMYSAAEIELADGNAVLAKQWFERILALDPQYKDVQIRIREIKT